MRVKLILKLKNDLILSWTMHWRTTLRGQAGAGKRREGGTEVQRGRKKVRERGRQGEKGGDRGRETEREKKKASRGGVMQNHFGV